MHYELRTIFEIAFFTRHENDSDETLPTAKFVSIILEDFAIKFKSCFSQIFVVHRSCKESSFGNKNVTIKRKEGIDRSFFT